jgi:uncharacterized cupredoxin-like copper-binding protein
MQTEPDVHSEAAEPPRYTLAEGELERLLAHDTAERERERQESRAWVSGLAIGATVIAVIAIIVSLFALTRDTSRTTMMSGASPAAMMSGARSAVAPVQAPPAALGHRVSARMTEMRIADSVSSVAAGKVTFSVTNAGMMTHEYVVLRTSQPAASLPMSGGRASEAGHVGETGDMAPGATKTFTLNLRAGHYSIVCNLPGHYSAGMYTDLTVR